MAKLGTGASPIPARLGRSIFTGTVISMGANTMSDKPSGDLQTLARQWGRPAFPSPKAATPGFGRRL